ncbi:MAG TPA: UDP-glucose 4-epimerase GalE [Thermoanaerobaculia bacterium]|nr:UDP-glucose 4-epimerase GalE [Thermoanaerobaculia bacterium]
MSRILVTGGAGYIGSHTCVELLGAGHDVVVIDDLSNSSYEAIERVQELAGRPLVFERVDLCDRPAVERVLAAHPCDAVVHFAGLKAVGESTEVPLRYYRNNVGGTIALLEAMQQAGLRRLVFSSSCTVYGAPRDLPVTEDAPLRAVNPYGRTKLIIEDMLRDLAASEPGWRFALLRYFNPIGAHASGRIGEDPEGIPNNLMPYLMQVAVGRREHLRIFGGDYDTRDGTCIRDYIHVVDLALGHLAALGALDRVEGARAFNLGTGRGSTVLEVVEAASRAVGRPIPHRIVERRPGDAPAVWADPSRAERELGWVAERTLDDMCADSWRWQSANPHGFPG